MAVEPMVMMMPIIACAGHDVRLYRDARAVEIIAPEGGRKMRAAIGDRIVIKGNHVGEPDHDAEILEVRGTKGSPPYLVRWSDTGHEVLLFPGTDAFIQHFEHHERSSG